jgi:hypothetical protein
VACIERLEPQVPRREVELLVIERIVGDVHLPIEAPDRTVGVQHDRGIMVNAGGAPLEDGTYNDDAELPG